MFENIGDTITIGLFVNCLYDYLKTTTTIHKDSVLGYFSAQQIRFDEQQARQIAEVIEVKNLQAEAQSVDKEIFVEKLENDEQLKQVVENINQTYIQNQSNITTQNNFSDSSRQINTEGGNYNETHNHYAQAEKSKKS